MGWKPRPWFWAAWLGAIALSFAIPETFALVNHGTTLSAFMWQTTEAWPLFEFVWGVLIGGLAVHFWWHWNPPATGPLKGTGGAILIALLLGAHPAKAGPLDDCKALLPGGVAPALAAPPAHHTELCRLGYVLSHDDGRHEPRWVAWTVTAAHLNGPHTPRTDDFRADPDLPAGASATPADYARSGYDQGHMADAEDNSWSPAAEHQSFLMSNMIPQTPAANRQVWRYIENWTRARAAARGTLYVLSGPLLGAGDKHIGKDQVEVPFASWKLVVDPAKGTAWGFIVGNLPSFPQEGGAITRYQMTPREIELACGCTLPLPPGADPNGKAPLD